MSSSRKRAAIQKIQNEKKFLEQQLITLQYHYNSLKALCELACAENEELKKRLNTNPDL
jgi:hypothetical protein